MPPVMFWSNGRVGLFQVWVKLPRQRTTRALIAISEGAKNTQNEHAHVGISLSWQKKETQIQQEKGLI